MTFASAGWIAANVLLSALRAVDSRNLSKDSLREKIFSSGVFEVDDMLFGMYTKPCAPGGLKSSLGSFCGCNEGYRITEIYSYDNSKTGKLRAIPELRTSYPLEQCLLNIVTFDPVLVYLTLQYSSDAMVLLNSSASDILAGMLAQEEATGSSARASFETIVVSSSSSDDVSKSVATRVEDRYVSLLFGLVLNASNKDVNVSGYPLLDPLYFPAVLQPPFVENVVYLSATLEQELFVLVQYVSAVEKAPLHSYIRSAEAAAISSALYASAVTFGVSMASATLLQADAAFLPSIMGPSGGTWFVIGLQNESEVALLLEHLRRNPGLIAAVSFSELSVLYDAFVMCVVSVPQTCSQILFATALRNWNSMQLARESSLMADYFSAPMNGRSPLSLRGFLNSAAVAQVVSQLAGSALLPATMLEKWYNIGVVGVSSTDFFGPYSAARCSNFAVVSGALCEINSGARVIRVMSMSDVATVNATNSSGARLVHIFASSKIPYVFPVATSSLTSSQVAGIAVGCVTGVIFLVVMFAYFCRAMRNNKCAPKDPNRPVTLIFTDIQSSTSLWARTPAAMGDALDQHHDMIRHLIAKHECYEVKTIGDAFMVACEEPRRAVALAVELQHMFFDFDWKTDEIDHAYRQMELEKGIANLEASEYRKCWNGLRVRVGIHTGLADIRFDETTKGYDYYGNVSNMAARTESYGCGGQVTLTQDVIDALGESSAAEYLFRPLGSVTLRGASAPISLFDVVTVPGREFPLETAEVPPVEHAAAPQASGGNYASEKVVSEEGGSSYSAQQSSCSSTDGKGPLHHRQTDWERAAQPIFKTTLSLLKETDRGMILKNLCLKWHVQPHTTSSGSKNIDDAAIAVLSRRIGRVLNEMHGSLSTTEQHKTLDDVPVGPLSRTSSYIASQPTGKLQR